MKCFVYFYNHSQTDLTQSDYLPPNGYYLRVNTFHLEYQIATFFFIDSDGNIKDIFEQIIPSCGTDSTTRLTYWCNLVSKMSDNGIDELDIYNTNSGCVEDIKRAFSSFKVNIR